MLDMVFRERLAHFGDAALSSVKCLAFAECVHCSLRNEFGRRQIALANPQRYQPFTESCMVDNFNNSAFRRSARACCQFVELSLQFRRILFALSCRARAQQATKNPGLCRGFLDFTLS